MIRVAVEGASGYAGMELTKLLARHPSVEVIALSSGRWAGKTAREMIGTAGDVGKLVYEQSLQTEARIDAVFLATPAEASRTLAQKWLSQDAKVIDLSDAYRGDPSAVYGLTEHARDSIKNARLLANPGCYPTATQLALLPLIQAGLLADGPIMVDAKSGTSGAGRRLDDSLLFNELDGNHYPYNVGSHRHVPEIERGLGREILFTPHLLPTLRGLLISAYVPVADGVDGLGLEACLRDAYAAEAFVDVVEAGPAIGIRSVVGTPLCRIAVAPVVKAGTGRIFGVIDNLLKGAASQAIQNFNLMMGLEEHEGIEP